MAKDISKLVPVKKTVFDPRLNKHIVRTYYIKPKAARQGKTSQKSKRWVDEELIQKAVKEFGLTYDPRKAGYMLPDGRMLDFSGGQDQRIFDHSDIAVVYKQGGRETIWWFLTDTNSIRMSFYGGDLNLETIEEPTKQQMRVLQSIIKFYRPTTVIFDRVSKFGDVLASWELKRPTPISFGKKMRATFRKK